MPCHVLIAEDEWLIARHIRQVLTANGFVVAGMVRTTTELMEVLEARHADVLLLDISLEHRDAGLALVERHALGTRLAVVFVTAHADPPTIERARRAGCAGYLVKPFAESAILDAVHQAMSTLGARPR